MEKNKTMGLRNTLEKQGGIDLIKRYWKGGAFFTAVGEFMLLGKSRTALEILRLSATLKIKQKLERKYKGVLVEFDRNWKDSCHKTSNKIWVCWFQGIDNAPSIVKKCFQSIKHNLPDREVILITSENMSSYVKFPDYILDKWKSGKITHTHMTDLLRLELLINYGGTWIDSTVLCSSNNIPDYMLDSDLFFFQSLKPGRDGHATYPSTWFISAKSSNKLLMATRALCYAYWKDKNEMWDYFLLHDFFSIVLDYYEEEWQNIVPRDNATPHILLLRLFEKYDENVWNAIKEQVPFHKLSYKYDNDSLKLKGTYYDVLFND